MKSTYIIVALFFVLSNGHAQLATPENFFVFVGEQISLDTIGKNDEEIAFDRGFRAKFKVLKKLYGNFSADTISFESYIHKGRVPGFARCENAILYLTKDENKWIQEKYTYDEVFPTENGRWAGVGESWGYKHENNEDTKIIPEKILFVGTGWSVGNYAEDLFSLRRNGVLKARGLFKE